MENQLINVSLSSLIFLVFSQSNISYHGDGDYSPKNIAPTEEVLQIPDTHLPQGANNFSDIDPDYDHEFDKSATIIKKSLDLVKLRAG